MERDESISVAETPVESGAPPSQQQAAAAKSRGVDSDDEREIREWNLRFLFDEYKFLGPVWQGLQDAGWTHIPARNSYRSPHGTEFAGGKAIAEYLDLFCIPPICNTLQLPPQPIKLSVEEIKQGQELRECVVRNVYKRMMESNKTQKNQKDDSSDQESEAPAPKRKRAARRQSTKSAAASKKSATAFEKGADTFLRRSRGGSNKTVSSQDLAFLKFPSVVQCVEQFRNATSSSESVQQLEREYKEDFDDWKFLLTTQNPPCTLVPNCCTLSDEEVALPHTGGRLET